MVLVVAIAAVVVWNSSPSLRSVIDPHPSGLQMASTPSVDTGCFSRVIGSTTYTWCDTGGATPNLINPSPPPASGAAGSVGISAETAIRLARSHVSADATFVSAAAQNVKGLTGDAPDRLVWAVFFTAQYRICPPPGGACRAPQPGQTIVFLDYRTGDFVESSTSVPEPRSY